MKTKSLIIILILITNLSFGQEFTNLKGEYLGQTPPGDTAVVFAPGIISLTNRRETKIVFSPDGKECYFGIYIRNGANHIFKSYYNKCVNNLWTKPMKVPFLDNLNAKEFYFTADGNRLYVTSNGDIFMFERVPGGWGEPQRLPSPINSDTYDMGYTETTDGVVYLWSGRPGRFGEQGDIWRINPSSEKAENLGPDINAVSFIGGPCIAPNGSFLIFSARRPGRIGNQDLFISFNQGNYNWSEPINMEKGGVGINIANHTQNRPTLSPDGKYLFFCRHNVSGTMQDVYWVSTNIIQKLKDEYEKTKVTPNK